MPGKSLYLVRLTGQMIDQQSFSCTGKQMAILLRSINKWSVDCQWNLFDIRVISAIPAILSETNQGKGALGTNELIRVSAEVDQFMSGVFIAVPRGSETPNWRQAFLTEDDPPSDIGNAVVEIRTFDTSYFEIYSELDELIDYLKFNFPEGEFSKYPFEEGE